MTPRTQRHRPLRRRGPRVPLGRTAIVVELLCALGFLGYLLSHEGVGLPFVSHRFTIQAVFTDAAGLDTRNHSEVTVAGVPLGRVESVAYRDGDAVATLSLSSSAEEKIHAGATAQIAPRSALQDLTVDIDPGRPGSPLLGDGGTIPVSHTTSTPGSDRLIDVLDADTRSQVQVLLGELQVGLRGRAGNLRADLSELGRVVDSTKVVTRALAQRRALLTRFVGDLDTVFKTLGARQAELADGIDVAQRTLSVTGERDRELAASMRALPGTLTRVDGALRAVRSLATPLEPALVELHSFADHLPDALAALRRFVPAGTTLISDVRALTERGRAPLHDLSATLQELGPAAGAMRPWVSKALPVLRAVDRNKEGIGQLGDRFSGVFSTNDANGPILRGLGFFEPFDPADLGFSGNGKTARLDTVTALTRVCLTENPVACLARYLVPSLPGAVVGSGAEPLKRAP